MYPIDRVVSFFLKKVKLSMMLQRAKSYLVRYKLQVCEWNFTFFEARGEPVMFMN
jgi:hypothetical protein